MKKLLLICTVATICFGFCSAVVASPTLPAAGSSQTDTQSYEVKKDSDSQFFLVDWLYWFLDDVLGIKDRDNGKHYYPVDSSTVNDPGGTGSNGSGYNGDSGWVIDPGDSGWNYDPTGGSGDNGSGSGSGDSSSGSGSGDNGSGSNSGNSGWGNGSGAGDGDWSSGSGGGYSGSGWEPYTGSGNGDWSSGGGTGPVQTIPAPGAFLLGGIGSAIVGWLRRRRTL